MMQIHGKKVINLTTGDLTDVMSREGLLRLKKISCEKSAEVIVLNYRQRLRKGGTLKSDQ